MHGQLLDFNLYMAETEDELRRFKAEIFQARLIRPNRKFADLADRRPSTARDPVLYSLRDRGKDIVCNLPSIP